MWHVADWNIMKLKHVDLYDILHTHDDMDFFVIQ